MRGGNHFRVGELLEITAQYESMLDLYVDLNSFDRISFVKKGELAVYLGGDGDYCKILVGEVVGYLETQLLRKWNPLKELRE